MHYSEEQIKKAKSVDLPEFLKSQGEQLIKSGREYRWAVHDSLTVRGNRWFQHSRGVGGGPIDFVMEFYGLTFPEAMKMLTGEDGRQKAEDASGKGIPAPLPEFRLPKRNRDENRVLEYLTDERGLDEDMVLQFIRSGEIYEDDKYHNVVFVGKDPGGIPASDRALTAFLSASPQITSVFLCLDNDKAGNKACEKLLLSAAGCKRVIRLKTL